MSDVFIAILIGLFLALLVFGSWSLLIEDLKEYRKKQ